MLIFGGVPCLKLTAKAPANGWLQDAISINRGIQGLLGLSSGGWWCSRRGISLQSSLWFPTISWVSVACSRASWESKGPPIPPMQPPPQYQIAGPNSRPWHTLAGQKLCLLSLGTANHFPIFPPRILLSTWFWSISHRDKLFSLLNLNRVNFDRARHAMQNGHDKSIWHGPSHNSNLQQAQTFFLLKYARKMVFPYDLLLGKHHPAKVGISQKKLLTVHEFSLSQQFLRRTALFAFHGLVVFGCCVVRIALLGVTLQGTIASGNPTGGGGELSRFGGATEGSNLDG